MTDKLVTAINPFRQNGQSRCLPSLSPEDRNGFPDVMFTILDDKAWRLGNPQCSRKMLCYVDKEVTL